MTTFLEEIALQPAALARLRKHYVGADAIRLKTLGSTARRTPGTIFFTGMGSSLFAAYPAQAWLTNLGIQAFVWETSELLHHHLNVIRPETVLVIVSQSGESAEIVRLLDRLPDRALTVGVVNSEASTLARRARLVLPTLAGPEATVTSSTYTCSVAALMYWAFAVARRPVRPLHEAMGVVIKSQEQLLEGYRSVLAPAVDVLRRTPYAVLLSRGPDLATAFQASLMFKEVAHLAAEPMSAAHFRHGPIELIDPDHGYVIFARHSKRAEPGRLLVKLAREINSYRGRVVLFTDEDTGSLAKSTTIKVAPIRLGLGTLLDSVYIQLLVHELAVAAGLDPGKLKIAQNVTREE